MNFCFFSVFCDVRAPAESIQILFVPENEDRQWEHVHTEYVFRLLLHFLVHLISFLLELLAKSLKVFLFPGASVPRPSAAPFPPLPTAAVCLNVNATSPPSLKTRIHSSYSLIFPTARMSL